MASCSNSPLHPFTLHPFTVHPFTRSPFTPSPVHPSPLHPFTLHPFTVHPFTPSPFTVHPSPLHPSPFTRSPFTPSPFTRLSLPSHILRKAFITCLILCAFCCSPSASAQVVHMPGVWVAGGEHSLLVPSPSVADNSLGGEGAFGVDYMLKANHFLMNVGAGVHIWRTAFKTTDANVKLPGAVDIDDYDFTFVYDIADRRDVYSNIGLQLPVMLGANFGNAYFLVGAKFCYSFAASAKAQMKISTYGDYPQFLDPFTGMPEHQYFNAAPRSFASKLPSGKMDITASAEFGWQMLSGEKGRPSLFLSVYADVGMLDFFATQSLEALQTPSAFVDNNEHGNEMIEAVNANHLLSTNAVAQGVVRNLSLGVKVSLRFPYKQSHHSHFPCMCDPFN